MADTNQHFSAIKKADETIALLIQHQPDLIKISYSDEDGAEHVATFISTLRQKLTDMYNLNPPL